MIFYLHFRLVSAPTIKIIYRQIRRKMVLEAMTEVAVKALFRIFLERLEKIIKIQSGKNINGRDCNTVNMT